MSRTALAAAFPLLLLAGCGGSEPTPSPNGAAEAEANALENSGLPDPGTPAAPADQSADPVPPPDAVSHPNGYLPPDPGGAGAENGAAPGPDRPPPATEDEYIRNGQGSR